MMKQLALLSLAALSVAACGSSDGQAATAGEGDDFCRLAQIARDDEQDLEAVDATDANAVELSLTTAIDSLTAMAAKAPKDISTTVSDLLAQEEDLEALLKENDYDIEKMSATEEGKALLDDESIGKNGDALDVYLGDKCGIDTSDETDDTTAVEDTIAVDDTVPEITIPVGDTIVDLGEGEEAINQFLDFFELGTGDSLTDEQRSCLVTNLVDKVTGADLNQAIAGEPTEAVQLALGQAFIDCDVDVQT
jgi:hypothetical protein